MLAEYTGALVMTIWFKLIQTDSSGVFFRWQETVPERTPLGWTFMAIILMIAAVSYTIIGYQRGKHVWVPLVLSSFALGLQVISALSKTMHYCDVIIDVTLNETPYNAAHLADFAKDVAGRGFAGVVMVMCGGLFSTVLSWQKRRRLELAALSRDTVCCSAASATDTESEQ